MKSDYLSKSKLTPSAIPRIDFHLHTTWTDGRNTAAEMHDAAVASRLEAILFSEHARKSSEDWFFRFAEEIRKLPSDSCRALVGVETKIESYEGELDTTPGILAACDLVMAVVHRFPGEQGIVHGTGGVSSDRAAEIELELSLAALTHPNVDILGHPFGMTYKRFGGSPPESFIVELVRQAAAHDVAIEINCHYHPDPWRLARICNEAGARISLGSNAHDTASVGAIVRSLEGGLP